MKMIICIIIVLILLILYLTFNIFSIESTNDKYLKNNLNKENFIKVTRSLQNSEKYVWTYWENINRLSSPTFINLCFDIMKKHLNKYNLIFLNENNISTYLPNLRNDFGSLHIAQKVDYYRIALLQKYGGIWIDADVIILKDLKPIFDKLEEGYDYIGFGCTGGKCNNGYGYPSNWVMGAKKNSILMTKCLQKLDHKLDNLASNKVNKEVTTTIDDATYHDFGKIIIWESISDIPSYEYFHFTSEYDGNRDNNLDWIHTPNFFSTSPTQFIDESKVMFVILYNSEFSNEPKAKWIYDCEIKELLHSPYWISILFRQGLGL